jgi:hypothetical protein
MQIVNLSQFSEYLIDLLFLFLLYANEIFNKISNQNKYLKFEHLF